ncbi:MAG: hypothetical protein JSW28_08865 [Thermoplasmata archaeon]|nr:MAG: hypothetical protein JSW28_08865 [Thermoplasmata archaeon]
MMKSILRKDTFSSITLRKIMFILIIVGILLRIWVFFYSEAGLDATYFIILGKSISGRGDFYLPFGDIETDSLEPTQGTSSRQVFPVYLAMFYTPFGFDYNVTKIAVTVLSFLTLLVVYLTTKNLFGRDNALVVTAIVSVISTLIYTTGFVYSENITYLFLTIGLWGLLKGDKFFPVGIISISIFYISKSYSLILYIVFVCLFYSWVYYKEKRNILGKHYIFGIIATIPFIFLLFLSRAYGSYPATRTNILDALTGNPVYFFSRYMVLLIFMFVYLLGFAIYFYKPLRSSFSSKNLLWMVVAALFFGLPFMMAYQDYVYQVYERFIKEGLRAVFFITLPILWLAVPNTNYDLDEKLKFKEIWNEFKKVREHRKNIGLYACVAVAIGLGILIIPRLWFLFPICIGFISLFFNITKWKIAILCIMLVVVSINDNTGMHFSYRRELGEDMNDLLEDGDVIMFDGIDFIKSHNGSRFDRYCLAPYVKKEYRIINYDSNETPDFIITQNNEISFQNYSIIRRYYVQDKKGVFTQIYNEIYKAIKHPPELQKEPEYIVWGRE